MWEFTLTLPEFPRDSDGVRVRTLFLRKLNCCQVSAQPSRSLHRGFPEDRDESLSTLGGVYGDEPV